MKKIFLVLIPLFVFASCYLFNLPVLHWLELKAIDWQFLWRGPIATTGDIVIAAIDEKSLSRIGRWPWNRKTIGELVQKINEADPKLVEMDIIFAEPDPSDTVLIEALAAKPNVIVGYFFYQNQKELKAAEVAVEKSEENFASILPTAFPEISGIKDFLRPMAGVVANAPRICRAIRSQGYFNAFPDSDGGIRRFPLMVSYRDKIFPSMGLETFSQQLGFDPVLTRDNDGSLTGISMGSRFIPTNRLGEMLINYRGGEDLFPIYSAIDILEGRVGSKELAGKTVLVGATAVGIYDLRVTPVSPNLPGVIAQANLLDNLYRGDFLLENTWTRLGSLGAMVLMTCFLAFFLPRVQILLGLGATTLLIGSYGYLVQGLFRQGILLSLASPALEAFSVFLTITIYRGLTEERQKKQIRNAFRYYLHPDIVEELLEAPEKLKLGGQRAECTILFADVRNFTTISEQMDPETLVQMMNEYFDPIAQEIIKEGGYIDKFIGDAVMAIFGAPKQTPDHPLRACQAALAMQWKVKELAQQFQEKYGLSEFKIGVGLHTGPVIIGNMGTSTRLNYTAMGDAVNLASRLETATKGLGVGILASEQTYQRVTDNIEARYVDKIAVKGKAETIRVYEIIERREMPRP